MLYSGSITDLQLATNVKQCWTELYICSTVVYNILFSLCYAGIIGCSWSLFIAIDIKWWWKVYLVIVCMDSSFLKVHCYAAIINI